MEDAENSDTFQYFPGYHKALIDFAWRELIKEGFAVEHHLDEQFPYDALEELRDCLAFSVMLRFVLTKDRRNFQLNLFSFLLISITGLLKARVSDTLVD